MAGRPGWGETVRVSRWTISPGLVGSRPLGGCREEVPTLCWERIDLAALTFRVEETETGEPLELPLTRQLVAGLERRRAAAGGMPKRARPWVFASETSASGHIHNPQHLYAPIALAGGTRFWFHTMRNRFITVAERDLMLPRSLTRRLVNHARPGDVTGGYAADWTVEQLRAHAQRIADRIDELMRVEPSGAIKPAAPVGEPGGP